jgi:DNA-binding NarL/FixJ family response regulator
VLTSNDDQAIVQDVHAAGVEGFLLKRSSMETLAEALTAVTAGSTYYCAESKEILASPPLVQRVRNSVALTPREREIICSIANGFGTKETAERLRVSAKTIANHLAALKDKLNIHETSGLVRYAIKQGWVDAP